MNWKLKWRIQKTLSTMPGGGMVYYLLQSHFGGLRDYRIDEHLAGALHLMGALESVGESVEGWHIVEIGTGWVPTIPLVMYLHGASECDTYDISRLLKDNLTIRSAKQLTGRRAPRDVPETGAVRRSNALRFLANSRVKAAEIMTACGIRYHAPADARATGLADAGTDLVYSYNVLEHVDEHDIDSLFAETRRILRPGGLAAHVIDLADHFSYADASLSPVHFLQFSAAEYARFNTRFQHQNRLREPEWLDRFKASGFDVVYWKIRVDAPSLEDYASLAVHDSFHRLTPIQNCTTHVTAVVKRV